MISLSCSQEYWVKGDENTMETIDVCKYTKEIIQDKGLKQKSVAVKAGYTDQQLSNLLNGRKIFSAYDILRIANALEVTPNDLFGITSNKSA